MNACSFKRISRKILQSESYLKSKNTAHELADRIIHSKLSDNDKTRYIDVLIKEGTQNRPEWFTRGDIRNHAIIPFLAGIDTVGAALSFAIRELLINPDIRHELKEEASRVIRRDPDLSMIEEMTRINLFMKEILRLYPPAFALYRVATNDFNFHDYKISKGETLIFFITACHTDDRYFENPYEFKIDRFARPDIVSGVYAPFGKGPHTCIGTGLSNIILPLNLATLLHYADFDYDGDINSLALDFTKPALSLDPGFSISLKPSENYKQSIAS
jgi:cytochrome P450